MKALLILGGLGAAAYFLFFREGAMFSPDMVITLDEVDAFNNRQLNGQVAQVGAAPAQAMFLGTSSFTPSGVK